MALFALGISQADEPLVLPDPETEEIPLGNLDFPSIEKTEKKEIIIDETFFTQPLELPKDILSAYDRNTPLAHLNEQWRSQFLEMRDLYKKLQLMQRHSDVVFVINQMLRMAPDHIPSKLDLATSYVALRFFDLAKEQYEACLELDSRNFAISFNYAEMYFVLSFAETRKKSPEEAFEAELKQSRDQNLRLSLENFRATLEKIQTAREVALRQKQKDSVQRIEHNNYMKVLDQAEDLCKLKIFLAHLWLDEETEAAQVMLEYDRYSSSPNWYLMNAAYGFYRGKDLDQARQYVRSLRSIYPRNTSLKFLDAFIEIGWLGKQG